MSNLEIQQFHERVQVLCRFQYMSSQLQILPNQGITCNFSLEKTPQCSCTPASYISQSLCPNDGTDSITSAAYGQVMKSYRELPAHEVIAPKDILGSADTRKVTLICTKLQYLPRLNSRIIHEGPDMQYLADEFSFIYISYKAVHTLFTKIKPKVRH